MADIEYETATAWQSVNAKIERAQRVSSHNCQAARLVCVSKTQPEKAILPILNAGGRVFGENRVREAQQKWPGLQAKFPDLELHLIGPLQSNKAADAVDLFDVIQTIDRDKIAEAVAHEMQRVGKTLKLLVQVNTGNEPQKAGVLPQEVDDFLRRCRDVHGLRISGLMAIPPVNEQAAPHFALLSQIAKRNGLNELSMGMSADFELAVEMGATYVRVGSAIFGERPTT